MLSSSLSRLVRPLIILQLCFTFSLFLWYATQPFMGEYFKLRSRMLLYEYVMGNSTIVKNREGQKEKQERQAQRFNQLPEAEQKLLREDYHALQMYSQRPPFLKVLEGIRVLIQGIPPFEQAWIFFATVIAILLLLKKEGAKQAAWLLPVIVCAYAVDNQLHGLKSVSAPDQELFPLEKTIIESYLPASMKTTYVQQEQLTYGWENYLIEKWLPSSSLALNHQQKVEEAEFYFTIARLNRLHQQAWQKWVPLQHIKLSFITLFIYILWNGTFAWIITYSCPYVPYESFIIK